MNLKQKKTYLIFIAISLSLVIFLANNAVAVPSLGVATGGPYAIAPGDSWEDYQAYFVGSDFVSGSEDNHGFALGPSGSNLTIFTNILDSDIYLLTDTYAWNSSSPIKFDGYEFIDSYDTGQTGGYKPTPYYAINLGPVCSGYDSDGNCNTNSGWTSLPNPPFNPIPFYAYTGVIEYENHFPFNSYLFAAADEDDNNKLYFNTGVAHAYNCDDPSCVDPFSPKTTSTTPIPEPATVLLLGSGLIGLALVGFKRKIKR